MVFKVSLPGFGFRSLVSFEFEFRVPVYQVLRFKGFCPVEVWFRVPVCTVLSMYAERFLAVHQLLRFPVFAPGVLEPICVISPRTA